MSIYTANVYSQTGANEFYKSSTAKVIETIKDKTKEFYKSTSQTEKFPTFTEICNAGAYEEYTKNIATRDKVTTYINTHPSINAILSTQQLSLSSLEELLQELNNSVICCTDGRSYDGQSTYYHLLGDEYTKKITDFMNTKYNSLYLFGGINNSAPPITEDSLQEFFRLNSEELNANYTDALPHQKIEISCTDKIDINIDASNQVFQKIFSVINQLKNFNPQKQSATSKIIDSLGSAQQELSLLLSKVQTNQRVLEKTTQKLNVQKIGIEEQLEAQFQFSEEELKESRQELLLKINIFYKILEQSYRLNQMMLNFNSS